MISSSIGYGDKTDFTKEKRYIPGPNKYEMGTQFFSKDKIKY